MIATDIAQRYAKGESLEALAHEYHMNKRTISKTVRAMGVEIRPAGFDATRTRSGVLASALSAHERKLATGIYCKKCEIILRYDPGQDGYCGECFEEVSHAVVPALALHCSDSDLHDTAADGEGVQQT